MAHLLSGLRSTVGAALRSHGLVGPTWSALITSASGPHRAFAGDAERPPPREGEEGEEEPAASPLPSPEESRPPAPRSGGMRRLADVLGQDLTERLATVAPPIESPSQQEVDALFADIGEGERGLSRDHEAAAASEGSGSPGEGGAAAAARMVHAQYGYAALGGVMPKDEPKSSSSSSTGGVGDAMAGVFQAQPRVHPLRLFAPGDTYEPADLNAYASPDPGSRTRTRPLRLMPTVADVRASADYRNAAFLSQFVSPAGRMLPRRRTRLPVHAHVKVMNAIKVARTMGFMAHEVRLEKTHLRRVREQELQAARARGLL
ncbi:hypothetical protein FOA52_014909 [Chlamydomonas sp. UWO 241]|nr:hypothetical protein FOA52_014909 [Chlamydomonas sp. UWO 241]